MRVDTGSEKGIQTLLCFVDLNHSVAQHSFASPVCGANNISPGICMPTLGDQCIAWKHRMHEPGGN